MKATHRALELSGLVPKITNCSICLALVLLLAGCGKKDAGTAPDLGSKTGAKAGVSVDQAVDAPPPAPAPDAPPPPSAEPGAGVPVPGGAASLSAEARKARNIAWLKILKTGSPQEKQKVQDQLTHLSSDELTEITELYEKQEKLR